MEQNASRKRSVIVRNRRTSISLEDSFWESLNAIVRMENITIGNFIEKIKTQRQSINLSSSLRVAVLEYYQHLASHRAETHSSADATTQPETSCGHGDQIPSPGKTSGFWSGAERRQSLLGQSGAGMLIAAHEGAS
jgi:predicted DNA-binding ribbon-helix-helix protein